MDYSSLDIIIAVVIIGLGFGGCYGRGVSGGFFGGFSLDTVIAVAALFWLGIDGSSCSVIDG